MKTNLSRSSFEEKKSLEAKTRQEARESAQPLFRGNLPSAKTSIEEIEKLWAGTSNFIELN